MLRDTFINVRVNDAFQIRFGQFKMPFSQEELVSDNRVAFVDRSSVNALSPGRSPGVEIHGTVADSFEYWVSAANGRGELGTNDTSTPEVLGPCFGICERPCPCFGVKITKLYLLIVYV